MLTTALAMGSLVSLAGSAEADCALTIAPNTYTCAGATTNYQILSAADNANISTTGTYGVTLTGSPAWPYGVYIVGNGTKTYTDDNATVIDTTGTTGATGGLYIVLGRDLPGVPASLTVRSNGNYFTSGAGVTFGGVGGSPESGSLDAVFTGKIEAGGTGLAFFTPGQEATITVNDVLGHANAISATIGSNVATEARVLGDLTINTDGLVRGEANTFGSPSYGINVGITNSDVSGIAPGVKTNINVASTSIVEGDAAAIRGVSFLVAGRTTETDLNPIVVNNSGIVRNNSQLSDALAITGSNVRFEINNNNLVLGTVTLGKYDDVFNNAGVWNTANGTNDFGDGNDTVQNDGTVLAAANAGLAETTTFNGLETYSNNAAGIIRMNDGATGDRTVIGGNYVSNDGTLALDTYLGTDGSPSDLLMITGNAALASAPTRILISNTSGPGALTVADGIKVVQVDGISNPNAFALAHNVMAGAYEYNLFYGGIGADVNDQDWYLRSIGLNAPAQEEGPYAEILGNFANATLGTLQQRTGNRIWPGDPQSPQTVWCKDPTQNFKCAVTPEQAAVYTAGQPVIVGSGAWGRVVGQYSSFDPQTGSAYTQQLSFIQGGYEGAIHESEGGVATFGLFGTYGTSSADIDLTRDPLTGAQRTGEITSTGYGVGANLTWLGSDGFYVDGVGQYSWYDSDLSSATVDGNDGSSYVLSLEAGKRFDLSSGLAIVPQVQLAYTSVDFDDFTDRAASRVSLGDGDSLTGRVGLRVEKLAIWQGENGQTQRLQVYGIANLTNEFLDGTSINVAGTSVDQRGKSLWGEIGLGGTYAWNDKLSIHGEASYATALSSGIRGDNYTAKGIVGLRYKW